MELVDKLWIGDSHDAEYTDLHEHEIKGMLNVAHDLDMCGRGWVYGFEYMQVGLIDGPGNEINNYCAAIMALVSLVKRNGSVLVYDHNGSRALVVAMMYLNLIDGKYRPEPLAWSHFLTWGERLAKVNKTVCRYHRPHTSHTDVFEKIPYGVLEALL